MARKRIETISLLGLLILTAFFSSNLPAQSIAALDVGNDRSLVILDQMGIAYIPITPAQLDTVDLYNFSVLYVGSTFLDGGVTIPAQDALNALNINKARIADFVTGGGGLLALSEPIGTGKWDWVPVIVAGTDGFGSGFQEIVVTNPSHPVMAGLGSSSLSNWGNSAHNSFTTTDDFEVIATRNTGEPVTLVGELGCGRIVLTGQDPDWHGVFGEEAAKTLIRNSLTWVVNRKGDLNADHNYSPSDVVLELICVFSGTGNCGTCYADVNCSGDLSPADVVLELNRVFLGAAFPC